MATFICGIPWYLVRDSKKLNHPSFLKTSRHKEKRKIEIPRSIFIFIFSEEIFQLPGFELAAQRVRRFRGYQLSYRGDYIERRITQ